MRQRPRLDGNHHEIAQAYRALGCSAQSLAALGGGVPDLLIGCQRLTAVAEVKEGTGDLTEDQERWRADWRGQLVIVRTLEDVCRHVELLRAQAAILVSNYRL